MKEKENKNHFNVFNMETCKRSICVETLRWLSIPIRWISFNMSVNNCGTNNVKFIINDLKYSFPISVLYFTKECQNKHGN